LQLLRETEELHGLCTARLSYKKYVRDARGGQC
jgi:hypothetical protein